MPARCKPDETPPPRPPPTTRRVASPAWRVMGADRSCSAVGEFWRDAVDAVIQVAQFRNELLGAPGRHLVPHLLRRSVIVRQDLLDEPPSRRGQRDSISA